MIEQDPHDSKASFHYADQILPLLFYIATSSIANDVLIFNWVNLKAIKAERSGH